MSNSARCRTFGISVLSHVVIDDVEMLFNSLIFMVNRSVVFFLPDCVTVEGGGGGGRETGSMKSLREFERVVAVAFRSPLEDFGEGSECSRNLFFDDDFLKNP